ncbi:hypothetical protein DH2020_033448 [Rehmannia glutinosa]|uniref:Uncharacterized protein n=1 Tax=Rehmannia glutinosa TaxID=99300 RepID=A0ABR0VG53_REHGL
MATSDSSRNDTTVAAQPAPEVENGEELKVEVFSSSSELLSKLQEKWLGKPKPYPAMYSSVFGGIILDPAMMVIPIDDHMVHRGHGVFDTAIILDGSITMQKRNPQILAKCGAGDFLLSPAGCPSSAFLRVVIDENFSQCKEGVKVITSNIPMKSPLFAKMKNVNYLPNVLAKMEAEDKGAFASIWVDEEAPRLVEQGALKGVRTGNLTVEEAKGAAEMMFVGSTLPILPIVVWDDKPIGDGNVGELTMALSDLLWEDMVAGPETQRLLVPYV